MSKLTTEECIVKLEKQGFLITETKDGYSVFFKSHQISPTRSRFYAKNKQNHTPDGIQYLAGAIKKA